MKVKKVHEVALFSQYVTSLCADIARDSESEENITHLVDFGSGQNYLGRTLASEPFNKHVIAVESKKSNIEGSRRMDVHAKLAPKVKKTRMVNKKEWNKQFKTSKQERLRRRMEDNENDEDHALIGTDSKEVRGDLAEIVPSTESKNGSLSHNHVFSEDREEDHGRLLDLESETVLPENMLFPETDIETEGQIWQDSRPPAESIEAPSTESLPKGKGSVQYVEHRLEDGNLAAVLEDIVKFPQAHQEDDTNTNTNDADISSSQPTNGTTVADNPPSLLVMVSKSVHLHTIFQNYTVADR